MKMKRTLTVVCVAVCVCLASSVAWCAASSPADEGRPLLHKLLKAVASNDYASFVADGGDAFKSGLSKQMLSLVSTQYAPRIKKGYDATYLGVLQQQGCQVQLWKLVYKDGSDDTLAKLVVKDGKVVGFWLQ